jgi:flagellar biosynthesis/type III secretory pathway ATPase
MKSAAHGWRNWMTLRLNVEEMAQVPGQCAAFRTVGKLRSVRGLLRADMPAFVGETCTVGLPSGEQLMAEVVGFDNAESQLMCFDSTAGLQPGLEIMCPGSQLEPFPLEADC